MSGTVSIMTGNMGGTTRMNFAVVHCKSGKRRVQTNCIGVLSAARAATAIEVGKGYPVVMIEGNAVPVKDVFEHLTKLHGEFGRA